MKGYNYETTRKILLAGTMIFLVFGISNIFHSEQFNDQTFADTREMNIPEKKNIFTASLDAITQDTCASEEYPDTNYGGDISLYAGAYDMSAYEMYIQINCSEITTNLETYRVYLELNMSGQNGWVAYDDFRSHIVYDAWDEMSLTWNNKPSFGDPISAISGSILQANSGFSFKFDITAAYNQWVNGELDNYGIMIESMMNYGYAYFISSEYIDPNFHPRIIIEEITPQEDVYEDYDTISNPYDMNEGFAASDLWINPADPDWFSLNVNVKRGIHLNLTYDFIPYSQEITIDIYNETDNFIFRFEDFMQMGRFYSEWRIPAEDTSNMMKFHIFTNGTVDISYSLNITAQDLDPLSDDSYEENDFSTLAANLNIGTHDLVYTDTDWFQVSLPAYSMVNINISYPEQPYVNLSMKIYDEDTTELLEVLYVSGISDNFTVNSTEHASLLLKVENLLFGDSIYRINMSSSLYYIPPNEYHHQDAYVFENQPDTNYGMDPEVHIGRDYSASNSRIYGYIQLNTSAFPHSSENFRVYLKMYSLGYDDAIDQDYFRAYPILESWNETTITWNNRPEVGLSLHQRHGMDYAWGTNNYVYLEITAYYLLWENGMLPNYGIMIESVNNTGNLHIASLQHPDGDHHPILQIEGQEEPLDDYYEPNDEKSEASFLDNEKITLIWNDEDWYSIPLGPHSSFTAEIGYLDLPGSSLILELYDSNLNLLRTGTNSEGKSILTYDSGDLDYVEYFLVVKNQEAGSCIFYTMKYTETVTYFPQIYTLTEISFIYDSQISSMFFEWQVSHAIDEFGTYQLILDDEVIETETWYRDQTVRWELPELSLGNHTITLRVSDAEGHTAEYTKEFEIRSMDTSSNSDDDDGPFSDLDIPGYPLSQFLSLLGVTFGLVLIFAKTKKPSK